MFRFFLFFSFGNLDLLFVSLGDFFWGRNSDLLCVSLGLFVLVVFIFKGVVVGSFELLVVWCFTIVGVLLESVYFLLITFCQFLTKKGEKKSTVVLS